jgi:hypothetical protein
MCFLLVSYHHPRANGTMASGIKVELLIEGLYSQKENRGWLRPAAVLGEAIRISG